MKIRTLTAIEKKKKTTYIIVPKAVFVYKIKKEKANYHTAMGALRLKRLGMPTGEQIASLIYEVYTSDSEEFRESPEAKKIREIIENSHLFVPYTTLVAKRDPHFRAGFPGTYIQHDPNGYQYIRGAMNVSELEKKLSKGETIIEGVRVSKDQKTAFAPYDTTKPIISEEQEPEILAKNGLVIATYGIKGAIQLANLASQLSLKVCVWMTDYFDCNSNHLSPSAISIHNYPDKPSVLAIYGDARDCEGFALGIKR